MKKKLTAKKIAAIVLSIVMVAEILPATIFAQAESKQVKPFYVVNWEYENKKWDNTSALTVMDYDAFDYVDGMPFTYFNTSDYTDDKESVESINISICFEDGNKYSNVEKAAQQLKEEFNSRPAGTRYLNLAAMSAVFKHFVVAVIDMRQGVELVNDWLDRFLAAYNAIGGKLDGIAIDLEYNAATAHYLDEQYTETNKNVYKQIVQNEYYKFYIRPQLDAMKEFTFYTTGIGSDGLPTNSTLYTSELWNINDTDSKSASAWNQVIQKLLTEYINDAVYTPLQKYYPEAVMSDYSSADSATWYKGMGNQGGQSGYTALKAGNASSERYYGAAFSEYFFDGSRNTTGADPRTLYHKPAGHYEAVFNPETAYTRALYDINTQKRHLASTVDATPDNPNDDKVTAWISYFNYASSTGYRNSPYYSEMIYHLGMTNPEVFQGYVMLQDVRSTTIAPQEYLSVLNDLMTELTRVAGDPDRKPIQTPIEWNEGYVLSGMYAGGRNIWRLTPNTDRVGLEEFLVKDATHPTFSANGLTITFPQGRIITDGPVGYVGTCGYWIETPNDVDPVVTASADRYKNNPSFQETFKRYKRDAFTASESSLLTSMRHPDTYWTASGTAEIVKDGDNDQAIALKGTTTLTNSGVPAKITAGDYYAKQQAWEVTVTLPAPSTYTSISLLSFDDSDKSDTDAVKGFVLKNGQVKYYQYSTEKTLSGVTLGAGTYTFKRVLDFAKTTSDYYVYNASGTLLGSVTNVTTKLSITPPVYKITMSTSGAINAVILDDYKLYPLGVTATLDIYDTVYGRVITKECTADTAARSEKIAYRLSWMNASSEYKKAVVYNTKNNKTIKEVLMAPGMDGYITGFVDASANNQVLLAVKQVAVSTPTQPTYSNDFSWDGLAENLGINYIVGDQGYAKLEDALTNAKDNQTVIMLTDAQLESTAVIRSSVKILANGNEISLQNSFNGDYAIEIAADGQLTWGEDLSINAGNKTALGVCGGTLTVEGGQITAQNGIVVTGGNLTVTGGNIAATDTAIMLDQDADNTPISTNVSGGTLGGKKALYHCNTSGTPSKDVTAIISNNTSYTGTVTTNAENFCFKTDANGLYLHGHTVALDATAASGCGASKAYCSACGDTLKTDDPSEHDWLSATCTAAKTCKKCGATEGDPKGHKYDNPAAVDGFVTRTCSVCSNAIHLGTDSTLKITYGTSTNGGTFEEALKEGMQTLYQKTNANGFIIDGNKSDWNIKVEWAENGVPTMTLKDATLKNDRKTSSSHLIAIGGTADFVIKLEGENKTIIDEAVYNTTTGYTSSNSGGKALYAANKGSLTITSDIDGDGRADGGNLKMESYAAHTIAKLYNELIFKDAHVTVNMQNRPSSGSHVSSLCNIVMCYGEDAYIDKTNLIIDGGEVTLNNKGINTIIRMQKTATETCSTSNTAANTTANTSDITIKNGAKVKMSRNSSGGGTTNKYTIRFGKNSKFTIKNSDVTMSTCGNFCFTYTPYLDGCDITEASPNKYDESGIELKDKQTQELRTFKVVHSCEAGEPVLVKGNGICASSYYLTSCKYCGKEMKNQAVESTKFHTVGNKEFAVTIEPNGTNEGKYEVTYTCSICNESWTGEETFYPAIFHYQDSAEVATDLKNWWTTSKAVTPKHTVQPGSEPIYFVTTAGDNGEHYVSATDNADNWTMKLEYPLGGTPVLTLKGATIINNTGLWYGVGKYMKTAPLKIVVEQDNRIAHAVNSSSGILNFHTTSDVTITGPGKLSIESKANISTTDSVNNSTIRSKGNLILDNANIDLFKHETGSYGNLIEATGGDITIDGGTLYMLAFGNDGSCFNRGIFAKSASGIGGNLTIRNSANVTIAGTAGKDYYGLLHASKDVTISESTVELAHGCVDESPASRYGDAIFCGGNFNVHYANGFTASYTNTRTKYFAETGELSVPTTVTTVTTRDKLSPAVLGYYYLKIQPAAEPLVKFEGTRIIVENNLDLHFALNASKVANTGYALITRSRVNANGDIVYDAPIRVDLKDVNKETVKGVPCYVIPYDDIAAKEMRDTVTIVVYDEHGNTVTETKTDSIYDYAMRTIRGSVPEKHTESEFDDLKKLLVDMLNYGTMAQIQFYHNNSNLANTNLSPNEWQNYATKDANMEPCFDNKPTQTPQSGVTATRHLGTTFSLTSSIAMKMAIDTTDLHEGSYAMVYMDGKSTRVDAVDYDGFAIYTYTGMVPKNGRNGIKWEFYTADGELKLTVTDSLANYVGRMVNQYPYLKNLMKYCDAAANYFPSGQ